ncbi:MAG: hypothetical protein PHF24_01215 [Syntrophomonas sp.]|nr:hypothetical protein [Syntrophomonas sp.]
MLRLGGLFTVEPPNLLLCLPFYGIENVLGNCYNVGQVLFSNISSISLNLIAVRAGRIENGGNKTF